MGALVLVAFLALLLSVPAGAAPAPPPAATALPPAVQGHLARQEYEEARELLLRAWEQGPRTAALALALGQVHRHLLDYPRALGYLEEARRQEPENPEVLFLLADTLIALDRTAEARPLLAALVARGYRPGPTQYLLGLAAAKERRPAEAAAHFRQAARDPVVAQEAALQESLSLAAARRLGEAESRLQETVRLGPYTGSGALARELLLAWEPRLPEVRRFRARVAAGFAYDSNVTLQPGAGAAAQQVSGQGDVFYHHLAELEYNLLPAGPWALWASYSFYQTLHRRLTRYDVLSHTWALTPTYVRPRTRWWLPLSFSYIDVGSDKYSTAFTASPTLLHLLTPRVGLEAGLRLARLYYWLPVFQPQDDRSGRQLGASAGLYYFLADGRGFVLLRFNYDHVATSGDNWDRNAYRLTLGARYPVTSRLTLRGFGEISWQPYVHVWVGDNFAAINPRRRDTLYTVGAEASYRLWRGLEAVASWYFIRDDSNIALYDYRRHLVGLQLGYRH
ncbi:MAG: tetratricopeptide repeat protein [Syntrophobacterales bacterium]|nr:tetratricopeptide repeat protein [Syntrophobacterales bacterium]